MSPKRINTRTAAPRAEALVEIVERKTKRWLIMETHPTDVNLAKCNPQSESPLYGLPKELRDLIYEYACTPSPDTRHPYKETAFFYRPGHVTRHKTYTSLLFTCRRAWLEANALPMQQAEHCFWFQRGPYDPHGDNGWSANLRHERDRYARFLRSLTTSNLQNVTYIHLFLQMFQAQEFSLDGRLTLFFSDYYVHRGLRPKTFHITIRQSDWWNWERDDSLSFNEDWIHSIFPTLHLGGVEEFKLELETLASKKDQLDPIVENLQRIEGQKTPVDPEHSNSQTESTFVVKHPPQTLRWSRSSRIDEKGWPVFKDTPILDLYAVAITWSNKHSSASTLRESNFASPAPDQSPAFPLAFDITPAHSPAMVLRNRSRKALMSDVVWKTPTSFPWYADAMRWNSDDQARMVEDKRRMRFERMLGDVEADKLMQQWNASGSLLRFGGIMP